MPTTNFPIANKLNGKNYYANLLLGECIFCLTQNLKNMWFGHKYDIRIKAELSDGQIIKGKMPIEARFVNEEELIYAIKEKFEKEIKWEYGLQVKRYLEIYDAS